MGPACHEDKMNQRARTLVLFLVICTCASLFYIGILLYLNSGCRGNKNINVYRINAAEDDYRADLDIVGKNANCLYNIDPASTEQSTVDDREQQFHPNNKISFHKRHPTRSRTRINATMKAHGTDQAPHIAELSRKVVPVPSFMVSFDPYAMDTMVYMHIQKTEGSEFLEHLVVAQIPLEQIKLSNGSKMLLPSIILSWSKLGPVINKSQGIPLCRTSPTGGWKRSGDYLGNGSTVIMHHELCPRDWEHPNGDTWLVSEKTTAWACGVHAFYTDFKKCLQNPFIFNDNAQMMYKDSVTRLSEHNRFHYVVILRHPLLRYISEYLHVSRGACWAREDKCIRRSRKWIWRIFDPWRLKCPENLQCRKDIVEKFLDNLTLEKFLRCTESWSVNRMTLSLADHELATCWDKKKYSRKQRDQILLASAKSTLSNISYFGLNEFIAESGLLFEKTFGLILKNPIHGQPLNNSKAGQFISSLIQKKEIGVFKKVIQNNLLDLELYEYALDIFRTQMRAIGKELDTDMLNYIQTLNITMHRARSTPDRAK